MPWEIFESFRISTVAVTTSLTGAHPIPVLLMLAVSKAVHAQNTGGILATVLPSNKEVLIFHFLTPNPTLQL